MGAYQPSTMITQSASRAYDKDRDGLSSLVGLERVILEEKQHAINRGAEIMLN